LGGGKMRQTLCVLTLTKMYIFKKSSPKICFIFVSKESFRSKLGSAHF